MRTRTLFAILAALHLAGAAVHLLWLPELAAGADAAGVARPYRELLLLAVAATGLLLLALGGLAARLATGEHWREPGARAFALAGALLWAGRAALELVFPVEVRLLGLRGISTGVLTGSAVTSLLFVLAWRGVGAARTEGRARRSMRG